MKVNCIIIEDEPLAVERLKAYVSKTAFLKIVAVFDNPQNALHLIKNDRIDLLFLDINLKEQNGIDFLETIEFNGKVIITTAYDKYALKSYDLDVIDYLLKPYSFDRFTRSIQKFKTQLSLDLENNYFFLRTEHRYERINYDELLYIKGMGDYRQLVCKSKKLMTLQTFNELESTLPKLKVVRIHKSYMVSLSQIERIEKNNIKIQNQSLPISKSFRERFFKTFNSYGEQYRN